MFDMITFENAYSLILSNGIQKTLRAQHVFIAHQTFHIVKTINSISIYLGNVLLFFFLNYQ